MYSPRLNEELVPRLYTLCQQLDLPMTVFANGALEHVMLRAEKYLAMGERQKALDVIDVGRTAPAVKKQRAAAAG